MLFSILQVVYDALNDLIKQYKPMMISVAYSILRDYHYTEDVVQDALLQLSQNMDKMDNIYSKRSESYIYIVTKNATISLYRKINNEEPVIFDDQNPLYNIEGSLDVEAFQNKYGYSAEIMDALSELNEMDRDILCLMYGDGYSGKEIAKLLDCKPDIVFKRLQRAREKLRVALKEGKKESESHDER